MAAGGLQVAGDGGQVREQRRVHGEHARARNIGSRFAVFGLLNNSICVVGGFGGFKCFVMFLLLDFEDEGFLDFQLFAVGLWLRDGLGPFGPEVAVGYVDLVFLVEHDQLKIFLLFDFEQFSFQQLVLFLEVHVQHAFQKFPEGFSLLLRNVL